MTIRTSTLADNMTDAERAVAIAELLDVQLESEDGAVADLNPEVLIEALEKLLARAAVEANGEPVRDRVADPAHEPQAAGAPTMMARTVTITGAAVLSRAGAAKLQRARAAGLTRQQAVIAVETGITDFAAYARNLRQFGRSGGAR
ncbi:MAG TPA: hypothetical protein VK524_26860 [Polyangiaceae bacterium]|nr:hypothetical protein [Polyangiaceae bacterium]